MQDYQFWTLYTTLVLMVAGSLSFLSYYLQLFLFYLDEFLEKKTETNIYFETSDDSSPEDPYNLFTDPDDKDGRTFE